jgi:hypothetical protein
MLLQLNINGRMKNVKSLDILHLVKTTLACCSSRELFWDPKADIVFLCKAYPEEIEPIRSQLDQKELYEWFFLTPFFFGLPIEDQRRCSMALLGREFIQGRMSEIPRSPYTSATSTNKANRKPRLSLQTSGITSRPPPRLSSLDWTKSNYHEESAIHSSGFTLSPIPSPATAIRNPMIPRVRKSPGPLAYSMSGQRVPSAPSPYQQATTTRNTPARAEEPANPGGALNLPKPSTRPQSVQARSPCLSKGEQNLVLPARYIRPASMDVWNSHRQESEKLDIHSLRNVSTPHVVHTHIHEPVVAELNPVSPAPSSNRASENIESRSTQGLDDSQRSRASCQMKRSQATKGHLARQRQSRIARRVSQQVPPPSHTSPTLTSYAPLDQPDHYPGEETVLAATVPGPIHPPEDLIASLRGRASDSSLQKPKARLGAHDESRLNKVPSTEQLEKALSRPRQPSLTLAIPQSNPNHPPPSLIPSPKPADIHPAILVPGPKPEPHQAPKTTLTQKHQSISALKDSQKPPEGPYYARPLHPAATRHTIDFRQATGSGKKKLLQGAALKPKVVKSKRGATIRRQKSKHSSLMVGANANARKAYLADHAMDLKPLPALPYFSKPSPPQEIVAPIPRRGQRHFIIERFDWLPPSPPVQPVTGQDMQLPDSPVSSVASGPAPFSRISVGPIIQGLSPISPVDVQKVPIAHPNTYQETTTATTDTTTSEETAPSGPSADTAAPKGRFQAILETSTIPAFQQYAVFAHGPYSALDSPASPTVIYRTIGRQAPSRTLTGNFSEVSWSTSVSSSPSLTWSIAESLSTLASPVPDSAMTDGSYYGIFGGEDGYEDKSEGKSVGQIVGGLRKTSPPRRVDSHQDD